MQQEVVQLSLLDKFLAWFETSKKQAAWGIAIIAVVAFVVSFFFWRHGQREDQASKALTMAMADMSFRDGRRVEDPEAYLKVAADYPGTEAAGRALLQAGGTLFTQGKFTEARTQFERFLHEYPGSPFQPEASLGAAACLDAEGKTSEAVVAYGNVAKNYPSATVTPQAQFALARIYEAQGKSEQAWLTYEKLAQEQGPASSMGAEAGVRAEELKEKMPSVATNETPITSSVLSALTNHLSGALTNKP